MPSVGWQGRAGAEQPALWASLALLALLSTVWLAGAQEPDAGELCPTGNYTAADCPNGSCYAAEPNGCGSRSLAIISDKIVPDNWPAGVDFTDACDGHDRCYFTPGSEKAACDDAFHEALLQECERALRCINAIIIGRQCFNSAQDNPLYGPCSSLADIYYKAVSAVAEGPFERDQADAASHAEACAAKAAGGGTGDGRHL